MNIVKIEKNGRVVVMTTSDNRKATFDVVTSEMVSYTGKKLTRPPYHYTCIGNKGEKAMLNAVISSMNGNTFLMKKIELFANCLELIDNNNIIPEECPKGYIKFVKDNNLLISVDSLSLFKNKKIIEQLPEGVRSVVISLQKIKDNCSLAFYYYNAIMCLLVNENVEGAKKLCKIYLLSIKNFHPLEMPEKFGHFTFELYNKSKTFYRYNYNYLQKFVKYLDDNRDCEYNTKIIKEVQNILREEAIKEHQEKIKKIEEMSNDTFTIIVPTLLSEFTDEGHQQCNCVGHYYHTSIINGENVIYFIRHTSNPKKSYITNRYNISSKRTVETRKRRNFANNDEDALQLIKEIDEKIKELLSEKE